MVLLAVKPKKSKIKISQYIHTCNCKSAKINPIALRTAKLYGVLAVLSAIGLNRANVPFL